MRSTFDHFGGTLLSTSSQTARGHRRQRGHFPAPISSSPALSRAPQGTFGVQASGRPSHGITVNELSLTTLQEHLDTDSGSNTPESRALQGSLLSCGTILGNTNRPFYVVLRAAPSRARWQRLGSTLPCTQSVRTVPCSVHRVKTLWVWMGSNLMVVRFGRPLVRRACKRNVYRCENQ